MVGLIGLSWNGVVHFDEYKWIHSVIVNISYWPTMIPLFFCSSALRTIIL